MLCLGHLRAEEKPAPADPAANAAAEEGARLILNRWIEAQGGVSELLALKTADFSTQISGGGEQPPIPVYVRATVDGRYRYDYTLPVFGQLTQAFDGASAWQKNDALGFGPLSQVEHFDNQAVTDLQEPMKIGRRFPQRRRLADETVGDRLLQVVEMDTGQGFQMKWFFEPETGLRVRITATLGGAPLVLEFSDFRWFQRVRQPYRIVRRLGDSTLITVRKSILYNEPSDPMLFSPPGSRLQEYAVMERMLMDSDAMMGNGNLASVTTMVIKAHTSNASSGSVTESTTYKKRPNLMVRHQETPGMGMEWQGFDGRVGWASSELQGYREMAGAELMQLLAEADMDTPTRLRQMSTLRRYLGETTENGRVLMGIAMATAQGPVGNFYYEKDTALLARLETFVAAGATGQLKVIADFSDYRQVGPIKMPYQTVVTNPALRLITTIEEVVQNGSIDDAIFEPKRDL